jgi:hypothetical protein
MQDRVGRCRGNADQWRQEQRDEKDEPTHLWLKERAWKRSASFQPSATMTQPPAATNGAKEPPITIAVSHASPIPRGASAQASNHRSQAMPKLRPTKSDNSGAARSKTAVAGRLTNLPSDSGEPTATRGCEPSARRKGPAPHIIDHGVPCGPQPKSPYR